jgi:hypothetical protein
MDFTVSGWLTHAGLAGYAWMLSALWATSRGQDELSMLREAQAVVATIMFDDQLTRGAQQRVARRPMRPRRVDPAGSARSYGAVVLVLVVHGCG